MYVSSQTSRSAVSIAWTREGKYSPPLLNKVMRLPGRNRFIALTGRPCARRASGRFALGSGPSRSRAGVELGGERRVVGDSTRRKGVVDTGVEDRQAARIDAIELEHRHHRRKRARRAPADGREHLDHAQLIDDQPVRLLPP